MRDGSKRLPHARRAALALLAALLAATAGCGQSGPLTLPGKRAKTETAPASAQQQTQAGEKKKDKSDASENGR